MSDFESAVLYTPPSGMTVMGTMRRELSSEKLKRVKIEGFRSIKTADIQFGDATVLIGANGAGKTNLIGFLQMLSYMMSENLRLYVDERRGADSILHFGSSATPRLMGELEFARGNESSTYGFILVPAAGDRLLFTHEQVFFKKPGAMAPFDALLDPGGFESAVPRAAQVETDPIKRVCQVFRRRLSEVRVYHFHNTTAVSGIRGLQNMHENRALLAQGSNVAVMLHVLLQRFEGHYRRIVEEMRQILPDFQDFVLEPDVLRGKEQIELRWISKYGTERVFGPEHLSDGSIRAVALLTLLLQPNEFKPGVIVIDEPELGLHPFAVSQIARLINEAAADHQIIISTQSSRIVSEFEPEQVVVVESQDGQSHFRHLSTEDLSSWLAEYGDLGTLFDMNVTGGAPV
ncbi:MAG TPA: AAA family ATPase [Fimbriimonadaceae bacterium]|nr:AAA family ATPase [Fimbriimonadaceae bacterium]